jgi:hypothetical protein
MIHPQSDEVLQTGNPNFLNPALKLSTNYDEKAKRKRQRGPSPPPPKKSVEVQALLTTTCDQFPIPE